MKTALLKSGGMGILSDYDLSTHIAIKRGIYDNNVKILLHEFTNSIATSLFQISAYLADTLKGTGSYALWSTWRLLKITFKED